VLKTNLCIERVAGNEYRLIVPYTLNDFIGDVGVVYDQRYLA
jgi:hypothetical protein